MAVDCVFCKIINGEIPANKIYEDDKVLAFLDINPVNPGHTLVIPKKHSENLIDTADEDLCAIIKAVKKIAPAIVKTVEAGGFNLGVNNGAAAGQLVNHLHFHIMPRSDNDGLELWPGRPYEEGQAKQIAEKIKKEL